MRAAEELPHACAQCCTCQRRDNEEPELTESHTAFEYGRSDTPCRSSFSCHDRKAECQCHTDCADTCTYRACDATCENCTSAAHEHQNHGANHFCQILFHCTDYYGRRPVQIRGGRTVNGTKYTIFYFRLYPSIPEIFPAVRSMERKMFAFLHLKFKRRQRYG